MREKKTAKLTAKTVATLTPNPADSNNRTWDTEIKGYYVRVSSKGTKTYRYFYRVGGVEGDLSLGRHGSITAEQARALAKAAAGQVASGRNPELERKAAKEKARRDKTATLGAFMKNHYEEHVKANHKRPAETLRVLNKEFKHLYSKKMMGITQLDVRRYENERAQAGLSPETIKRQVRDLKTALSKAAEFGIIARSPIAGMKQKKSDKQGRVRYLSKEEEKRLRAALEARQTKHRAERQRFNKWRQVRGSAPLPVLEDKYTDHLMPMVLLAMNTGMRRGELFNLRWADVGLNKRLLKVQGIGAKSGNTRFIPLNDEAFSALVAWRNQSDSQGLVFPSPRTGKRLDNISTSWANLISAAALVDFRFHDLRHHFASRLVMAGADIPTVRDLLGHASIEMTLRYSHLSDAHKVQAVALLNRE